MYGLLILARDTSWADEAWRAIDYAADQVLRSDELERLYALPDETYGGPVLVLYLGDKATANDARIVGLLQEARAKAFGVLPVVRDLVHTKRDVPELLLRLNAMSWDDDRDRVVETTLVQLGIAEHERKLFLSYRRQETSALALQLRRELSDRSYDVFLDRFSVPPGEDFQRRLDVELADKAFVLLLESESATSSPWVEHEVTYALSHRLALLALTLPDAVSDARFTTIDDAFRIVLDKAAFTKPGGELTASALRGVLREVEIRHASQLRARRLELLGTVEDWLREHGMDVNPVAEWALLSSDRRLGKQIWLVTPRAPVPADLRTADLLRHEVSEQCSALVIHETPVLDPDQESLIAWIADGRPLDTTRLQNVPELLA